MALREVIKKDGVVDLSRLLGKTKNRISRVGVELEGFWAKPPDGSDGAWHPDNSVKYKNESIEKHKFPYRGEYVSEPMAPIGITAWLKKNYPAMVNETCGLHVHMSFPHAKYYSNLMTEEFPTTVEAYLRQWGKNEGFPADHQLFLRLDGKNDTCTKDFWPDMQAKVKRKDYDKSKVGNRYTGVNYCFSQHKTIEIRWMPMFSDLKLANKAVKLIVDVTNASIVALSRKKDKEAAEIYLNESDVSESDEYIRF